MIQSDYAKQRQEQDVRERKYFKKIKHLDSSVFVEIPKTDLTELHEYRSFLNDLEMKWMIEFNGNKHYRIHGEWNKESGIGGQFGENFFNHCKLYRFDETHLTYGENDWRAKGLWLRDHYNSKHDVIKVHMIADNLCEFLIQEGIEHNKISFDKETKKPIN
jgi:hypothetical protein